MSEASYALEQTRYEDVDLVLAKIRGGAHFDVIMRLLRDLDAIAACGPRRVLVDETELGVGVLTTNQIRELAEAWKSTSALATAKLAIVAPSLLIYGLNRMAHAFAGDYRNARLAVFRVREEALDWLRGR